MNTILYGNAYDLAAVIDTGETRAFLLEEKGGNSSGEKGDVDLGWRRILSVGANAWLVLVKGEELFFEKLRFPEQEKSSENVKGQTAVRIADLLRDMGNSCRTVTKYSRTGAGSDIRHGGMRSSVGRRCFPRSAMRFNTADGWIIPFISLNCIF